MAARVKLRLYYQNFFYLSIFSDSLYEPETVVLIVFVFCFLWRKGLL